jgi:hypothetical protein
MAIDWETLIREARADPRQSLGVTLHVRGIGTRSRPQLYMCDDGEFYFVKFAQNPHGNGIGIFNEHVVSAAASLLGAPVPGGALVDVSEDQIAELMEDEDVALDFVPSAGIQYGSRRAGPNVVDSPAMQDQYFTENVDRLAALHVLGLWIPLAVDAEWLYNTVPPHEVWLIDHTGSLPGGATWSPQQLVEHTGVAPDERFLGTPPAARARAVERLLDVTPEQIAAIVAAPPDSWGIFDDGRVALASYMHARRERVRESFAR